MAEGRTNGPDGDGRLGILSHGWKDSRYVHLGVK